MHVWLDDLMLVRSPRQARLLPANCIIVTSGAFMIDPNDRLQPSGLEGEASHPGAPVLVGTQFFGEIGAFRQLVQVSKEAFPFFWLVAVGLLLSAFITGRAPPR